MATSSAGSSPGPASSNASGSGAAGTPGFSGIPTSGSSSNTTNQKKDSIIIGIDFGTTFSGAAWCYTGLGDRNKIKIVKSWPSNPKSLDKVSSVLQYSPKDTSKYKWGFEVSPEAQNPLKWFKLLLHQDSGNNITPLNSNNPGSDNTRNSTAESLDSSLDDLDINDSAPVPAAGAYTEDDTEQLGELFATLAALPEDKTAVDVVTDYLSAVYKHTRATIKKDYLPSFSSRIGTDIPLQFVLTVPAVWSDSAKALTLKAARAAGMDESHAKIQLVSEPEAAAIHCLRSFKETQDSLQVGDVYVIADCGGGTVDLISYEITAVEPRLCVKECVIGTGGLCGSTSLNRRFEALIKKRVGETEYANMSSIARGNTMRHFDDYLKPTFLPPEYSDLNTFEDEDDFDEVASYNCPLPGVADSPSKGIYKGHLILTVDEMKGVFEPTFTKITKLVQEQVLAAEKKAAKNVTGVLLVGGFGSSPYLYKHLSAKIKSTEGNDVKILQPVDAWTAIVRGAVSYGLSLSLGDSPDVSDVPSVDSRIARFSYGVCAAERFIPGYHPSNRMVFNRWSGDFYCPGRMQWFVTMGDEIPEREPISVSFLRRCPTGADKDDLIFTEEILCSEQPGRPPLEVDHPHIKHLLRFKADMSDVSRKKHFVRRRAAHGGDPYWEIRFSMLMKYQSASLEFGVEIGDKPVGKGTVEYMHEPPKEGAKEEYGI